MPSQSFTDEEIQDLYAWVDQVPLSRPKRNFTRDFSDGVLFAEAVNYFFPRLVEVHNYSAANSFTQKMYNWQTMNNKVLKRLRITLTQAEMDAICNCVPMSVEKLMMKLYHRVIDDTPPSRTPPPSAGAHRQERQERQEQPQQESKKRVASGNSQPPASRADRVAPMISPKGARGGRMAVDHQELQREVDTEILIEKEQTIQDLQETVEILETKVKKLEQLLRLKDAKIVALQTKLEDRR